MSASIAPLFEPPFTGPELIDSIDHLGLRYRIHANGGGLVALTAHVGEKVFVDRFAMVKDRAVVVGTVRLFGHAVVEQNAIVADSCTLRGQSSVGGEAVVRGRVTLTDDARVEGTSRVSGGVILQHFALVRHGTLSGSLTVT